jgi:hypothetical protein
MRLKSITSNRRIAGVTMVELVVTAFIASIFTVALVSVYVNGLKYYKQSVTLNMMYSDGIALFHQIGRFFRGADVITLMQPDYENDRITLHIPSQQGNSLTGGDITLYYDSRSQTLRMDDGRADHMEYNVRLLPPVYTAGRRRTQTHAYTVKSVVFEQAHDLIPNPTLDNYKLVRMRVVLQDPNDGDTLSLQFSAVNRNIPQG